MPKKLITLLKKKRLTLALVESCTGGYTSYLITKIPGASRVFKGAVIVYSLDTKNILFNLPKTKVKKYQGVSAEIALSLAKRVRKKYKADLGASVVGFAGPLAKKGIKVGTIYLACADKKNMITRKIIIPGSRDSIRKKASRKLIKLLSKFISK